MRQKRHLLLMLIAIGFLLSCAPMPFMSPTAWGDLETPETGSTPDDGNDPADPVPPNPGIPGVIPDDGLDDTPGLQAALSSVASMFEPVTLAPGVYHISAPLEPGILTRIQGDPSAPTVLVSTHDTGGALFSLPTSYQIELSDLVLKNLWIETGSATDYLSLSSVFVVADVDIATDWLIKFTDSSGFRLSNSAFLVTPNASSTLEGAVLIDRSEDIRIIGNLFGLDLANWSFYAQRGFQSMIQSLQALRNQGILSSDHLNALDNGVRVTRDEETDVAWTTDLHVVNNLLCSDGIDQSVLDTSFAIAVRMINGGEIGGNYIRGFTGGILTEAQINVLISHQLAISRNFIESGDIRIATTDYNNIRSTTDLWVEGNIVADGQIVYEDTADEQQASQVSGIFFSANEFRSYDGTFLMINDFLEDHENGEITIDLLNYNTATGGVPQLQIGSTIEAIEQPNAAVRPVWTQPYYRPDIYRIYE